MKTSATLALAVGLVASQGLAAPALGDKPVKWEYAELNIQRGLQRFVTGDEEINARSWEELADKLKAPTPKKEGTPSVHKLRVLNRLGADGWELAEHLGTDGTTGMATWTFKRRVP